MTNIVDWARIIATQVRYYPGRALFGHRPILADETEILCGEERASSPPAISLPDQLDKVVGVAPLSTMESEQKRFFGGTSVHAPTRRHVAKNVTLLDGTFYRGSTKHRLSTVKSSHSFISLENVACVSSILGTRFFGHWMRDDCTTFELARGEAPIAIRTPCWPDKKEYEDMFDQVWVAVDRATIKSLVWYESYSQNSLKRKLYARLRRRTSRMIQGCNTMHRVYLQRGGSGAFRNMANEDQIMDGLAKNGWTVIEAEKHTAREVGEHLSRAEVVASIEGSQMNHALYSMSSAGAVLCIEPPTRFSLIHKDWADCLGIRFGLVVGDGNSDIYRVSLDDLLRTADLLGSCSPSSSRSSTPPT